MKTLRRGAVLLPVLAVLAAALAIVAVQTSEAALAETSSWNRIAMVRGEWASHGCLETVRAEIFEAFSRTDHRFSSRSAEAVWAVLDSLIPESLSVTGARCSLVARAAGTLLPASGFDFARWRWALGLHFPPPVVDSVVASIADWIDADDEPEPQGAERDWYVNQRRVPPRNRPFASLDEFRLVRGVVEAGLDSLVEIREFRIPLGYATTVAVATLPGSSVEALERLSSLRQRDRVVQLAELVNGLPGPAGDSLRAHYETWRVRTTGLPDLWRIEIRARSGSPEVETRLHAMLERIGERTVRLVQWQAW